MASLTEFAQDILKHLDGGEAPKWFYPRWGLCANWRDYCMVYSLQCSPESYDLDMAISEAGLDIYYPFDADTPDYRKSANLGTLYQNPERLAFLHKLANGEFQ